MSRLFKNLKVFNVLKISIRYKNHPQHWSVLKKKKTNLQKALNHFDDFYKSVYGDSWTHIRSALLSKDHKYIAIVNNFSDPERICEELECKGAINLKLIYEAAKKHNAFLKEKKIAENIHKEICRLDKELDEIVAEKQINRSVYPDPSDNHLNGPKVTENKDDYKHFKPVKLQSIEANVTVVENDSRLIKSSQDISVKQLHEYVPARKLKGMDDFVLESTHYGYYTQGNDFSVNVEKEYKLNFPRNLFLYTFEDGDTKFPKPKKGSTEVPDYFVLDGASVLPLLSLDLQPEDKLLDVCAAPGGKAIMALQTLCPKLIVANDVQQSRVNRINDFLYEMLGDLEEFSDRFFITLSDARYIEDQGLYNKVLVDVPCTTDRHVLHENDNNIFKSTRIKERLRLPELQSEILANALKLAVVGGTVVYSTCSLSPIQNDGVVKMALKKAFEEHQVTYVVKDQTSALSPLEYWFNFGNFGLKYGHIVIPTKSRNWGPMYFCKMVRVQ